MSVTVCTSSRRSSYPVTVTRDPSLVKKYLSRADIRRAVCPTCHVAAGSSCVRNDGSPRESNHKTRMKAAELM